MTTPTARGRRILASVPVFLLAACGTAPATTAAAPPSSTTAGPTTTTTVTTIVITTTPDVPLPAATDGTDLAACADGTCEVQVKTGDVLPVPGAPLTVDVGGGEAGVRPDPSSGMTGLVAGPPGWIGILDDQMFTVGAVQGDQAVLKLNLR